MGFQLRFLTEVRSIVKFKLDNYRRIKKCCKFLNAYLLANIGADTAENEQHFAEILPKVRRRDAPPQPVVWGMRGHELAVLHRREPRRRVADALLVPGVRRP